MGRHLSKGKPLLLCCRWGGSFKIEWLYLKDLPNKRVHHLRIGSKSVTRSRDTQEMPLEQGIGRCDALGGGGHLVLLWSGSGSTVLQFTKPSFQMGVSDHQRRFQPPPPPKGFGFDSGRGGGWGGTPPLESLNESCAGHSCENCRTLLHMHTRTCMCGALFDLRAAWRPPSPLPSERFCSGERKSEIL